MASDLFAWLTEASLAGSTAILVVLLLRKPLRAGFGAGAAYAVWGLVPATLLATLLPASIAPALAPVVAGISPGPAGVAAAYVPAANPEPWLLLAWAVGLCVFLLALMRQQRRFVRGLGPLRPRADGHYQSETVAGLPAVIGWRSRIVLPRDFEQRYDPREQQLVLCHERIHRRRGDLPASAFAAALRCLFWFNPLVHVGAGRFRHDQELACDAAVLRKHPQHRRAYGDALLKTQLAECPLPIGCHWFGSHPLKERITMLKRPLPGTSRWLTGLALVAALTVACGWTAWAAQPARAAAPAVANAQAQGELAFTMKVKLDDKGERVETLDMPVGQPKSFTYRQDGSTWVIQLTLNVLDDGRIHIAADILRDGVSQGQPRLITESGVPAAIGIGKQDPEAGFNGIAIEMTAASKTNAQARVQLTEGLSGPKPVYPKALVAAGEGGTVMLKVLVGADGRTRRSEFDPEGSTLPASSPLVASARKASLEWVFTPASKDGQPVEGWVQVPVTFDPDRPASGG